MRDITTNDLPNILFRLSEMMQDSIRAPHGGFNNAHILGQSILIKDVAIVLPRYSYHVSLAIKDVLDNGWTFDKLKS